MDTSLLCLNSGDFKPDLVWLWTGCGINRPHFLCVISIWLTWFRKVNVHVKSPGNWGFSSQFVPHLQYWSPQWGKVQLKGGAEEEGEAQSSAELWNPGEKLMTKTSGPIWRDAKIKNSLKLV